MTDSSTPLDTFKANEIAGRAGAARSVFVLGVSQVMRILIGMAGIVLISRLLAPDDYGLFAMALPVLGLAALFQDLGISQVTICEAEMDHERSSTLFWLAIASGAAASLLVFVCAWPIASFFGRQELAGILQACSVLPLIGSLQAQHSALLTRQMRFRHLAVIEVAGPLLGFITALVCALMWRSYWALVASAIAGSIVAVAGTWLACQWMPGRPQLDGIRSLVRFGAGVSVFNVLNFVTRNADNVIIGRFLGVGALGLYDRAYRLLMMPIQQVNAPIGRVMVPALSRLAAQPERYRSAYLEAAALVMMVTQPAILTATILASPLILVALGPQWSGVAPIFAWLGLCSLHQVFTSTIGWLLLSQGRGGDLVRVSGFSAVTAIAAFAAGLPWGAVGVAAAYSISDWVIRLPVLWWLAGRSGPVCVRDLVAGFLPHGVASSFTAALLVGVDHFMPLRSFWELAVAGFAMQAGYVAIMLLFPSRRALIARYVEMVIKRLQPARPVTASR